MYQVKPKNANRFKHDFRNLSRDQRERVWEALKTLAETPRPHNSICLEKNYYRLKTGDIRIIYQIIDDQKLILIGAIIRRDESTYKDWKRLFSDR